MDDQVPPSTKPPELSKAQIHKAFSKAQGQFKTPELNRTAEIKKEGKTLYTTSYADLQECINCVKQALADNGLSFTQTLELRHDSMWLVLTLRHESGESLESVFPISFQGSPQVVGGLLTYYKRYQISAFFGLAADFDDDGNAASDKGHTGDFKPKAQSKPPSESKPKTQTKAPPGEVKPQNVTPGANPERELKVAALKTTMGEHGIDHEALKALIRLATGQDKHTTALTIAEIDKVIDLIKLSVQK